MKRAEWASWWMETAAAAQLVAHVLPPAEATCPAPALC